METMKRYSLVLPEILYDEIKAVAISKGIPVSEVLRKFIKLGLVAIELENEPGSELIIREGATEKLIII